MGIFDEKMTQPVILKEDSSLDEWLKQLTEFLQKPLSADVRERVENDIRYIKAGIVSSLICQALTPLIQYTGRLNRFGVCCFVVSEVSFRFYFSTFLHIGGDILRTNKYF